MKIGIRILIIAFIACQIQFTFPSMGLALTGEEIIQKVEDQETPETSMTSVKMTLINKWGEKQVRELVYFIKDYGELDKALIRFSSPPDIKGTGFLSWENKDRDNDQFLFLPALKKVRRISASQKSDSFMGTDFTYRDMEGKEMGLDIHSLLREEVIDGSETYVVESLPKDPKDSPYGKVVEWIRKDNFVPVKAMFYDNRGDLLKTFTVFELKKIDGYWIIMKSTMKNVQDNHQTQLEILEVKNNKPIPDDVFTKRYLQKR